MIQLQKRDAVPLAAWVAANDAEKYARSIRDDAEVAMTALEEAYTQASAIFERAERMLDHASGVVFDMSTESEDGEVP